MGVYRQRTLGVLGRAQKPAVRSMQIPACVGGINALSSLAQMPLEDCILAFNLMPSELGMELRKGFREWANEIGGAGTEEEVRALVFFNGQQADHSDDAIFAMTPQGIYNVTLFNTVDPTAVFTWAVTGGAKAGYGSFTNFANDAEDHFIYYADVENGLHEYDAETTTWTAVTGLTVDNGLGVQVAWGLEGDVTYVTGHKLRLWLTVDDSGDAWYLPVESNAGEVFKFTFGSKFSHGGYLMGLWSWSYESTQGIEDYLVAISRAGDVLIYKGSDPTQIDWILVGSYFIGEVTSSRNIAMNYGSEMYVLSTYGLTNLSDLIKGVEAYQLGASPTTKIARILRRDLFDEKESKDWGMAINATGGFLQIHGPYDPARPDEALQYNQNLLTQAWGIWRGVPVQSAAFIEGNYYMGTQVGQVLINDGTIDGTLLDGTLGQPVDFEVLTAFNPGDNPSQYKNVGFIRTVGILEGQAAISVIPIYDYAIQDSAPPPVPISATNLTRWDIGVWDVDNWDFAITGSSVVTGGVGWGRVVAVSLRGSSDLSIIVTGWDLMYTPGGLL